MNNPHAPALTFASFDPSTCGFPKPRVPLLPDCSRPRIVWQRMPARAPLPGSFQSFSRGRYALLEACRRAGVAPGTTVLLPSYNCRSMVDGPLALGADIGFYPLRPDLTACLDGIEMLAGQAGRPVRALLAAHFFGIPQDFTRLAEWCRTRDICLIEDCSHALFVEDHAASRIGIYGEFVIASPYKFFPSPDGGLLYASKAGTTLERSAPPGWVRELRNFRLAMSAPVPDPLGPDALERLGRDLTALLQRPLKRGQDDCVTGQGMSHYFVADDAGLAATRWSRFVVNHSSPESIAASRRDNFRRLATAAASLPQARALFTEIPDDCAPYMFPLYIEHPDPHFFLLKQLGMPIWRWDDMPMSKCAVAAHARLHLLHLPCHQSLDAVQVDWMITALQRVLAIPPAN